MNFDGMEAQAERIHEAIANMASRDSIRVGVNRSRVGEAVAKLRRGFFKKPFLASSKEWLRTLVVQDPAAFKFLAGHIELEAAYKGRLYRWTGYGTKIFPNEDSPAQVQEFIQSNLGPFFVTIQLGTDVTLFSGLLEDVDD